MVLADGRRSLDIADFAGARPKRPIYPPRRVIDHSPGQLSALGYHAKIALKVASVVGPLRELDCRCDQSHQRVKPTHQILCNRFGRHLQGALPDPLPRAKALGYDL